MAAVRKYNADVWKPFAGLKSGGSVYDPLDLASSSIDPLGFSRGYLALADLILPGFTTITSTPRYVSMLCAALKLAQDRFPSSGESTADLRKKRLEVIKSYEKAWALACGLAAQNGIGKEAIAGLRGIRYVKRRLESLNRVSAVKMNSFNLLANQLRYGAVGTYNVFLESMHLAVVDSLTLKALGEDLAKAMPAPKGSLLDTVGHENERLSLDELEEWGRSCHAGTFTVNEARPLRAAMSGGDEAEHADHVRALMLRLLAGQSEDDSESVRLSRSLHWLEKSAIGGTPEATRSVSTGLQLIEPFEAFYQACQFMLEFTQAAATANPALIVRDMNSDSAFVAGSNAAKSTAIKLLSETDEAWESDAVNGALMRRVLNESGIEQLAKSVAGGVLDDDRVGIVLQRHLDVQAGKYDGGQPKGPWIALNERDGRIALTAQRHQLPKPPESWNAVARHPYRTWSAMQFVKHCRIEA